MKRFSLFLFLLLGCGLSPAFGQVMNIVGAEVNVSSAGVFITTASPSDEALRIQSNGSLNLTGTAFVQVGGGFNNQSSFNSERGATVEFLNTATDAVIQYTHNATAVTNDAYKFGKVNVIVDELNLNSPLVVQSGGELNMSSTAQKCVVTTNTNYVQLEDDTPGGQPVTLSVPTGTFGQGSATARNTNFINGTLRWFANDDKSTYNFPVGTALRGLQHMQLEPSPFSLSAYGIQMFEASFKTASGGDKPGECNTSAPNVKASDFMWEYHAYSNRTAPLVKVTEMNLTGDSYTVTVNPRGFAPPGAVEYTAQFKHEGDATFEIYRFGVAGGNCYDAPSFYDIAVPELTRFSEVNPMFSDQPLPIELLSFTVQPQERSIRLNWSKDGQENALTYDVQRSTDLRNFATIAAEIPAQQDNASRKANYDHIDRNVEINTTYYYRIRQKNVDGKVEFSNILEARIDGSQAFSDTRFQIYPNPTTGSLELTVELTADREASVRIIDMLGRSLFSQRYDLKAGPNSIDLSAVVQGLASGTYQMVIESKGQRSVQKLIRY